MTPLSDALRRLAQSSPEPLRPVDDLSASRPTEFEGGGATYEQIIDPRIEAPLATHGGSWADAPAVGPPVNQLETTADAHARDLPEQSPPEPEQSAAVEEPAEAPAVRGVVRVYCDLTGDENLAFQAVAPGCDLVVHVGDGESNAAAKLALFEEPLQPASRVHWPGGGAEFMPGRSGAARARTAEAPSRSPREWVLFLEDCREAYDVVGLIIGAQPDADAAWLVGRCDELHLLTDGRTTPLGSARRAAAALGRMPGPAPSCLVVQAA